MNNILLSDIVSILRDGKTFYANAAIKVGDPELKSVFTRMTTVRNDILVGLPMEVSKTTVTPLKVGILAGEMHRTYVDTDKLLSRTDLGFVEKLMDPEARFLKALDLSVNDTAVPEPARTVLSKFIPELKACLVSMRVLSHSLKLAA